MRNHVGILVGSSAPDHTAREMSAGVAKVADNLGMAQKIENSNYTSKSITAANNLLNSSLITYPDQTELDRKLSKDFLKKAEVFSNSYKYFVEHPKYAPKKVSVDIDSNLLNQIHTYSHSISDTMKIGARYYTSQQSSISSALINLYGIPKQLLPKGLANKNYLLKMIKSYQEEFTNNKNKFHKLESGTYKPTEVEKIAAISAIEESINQRIKDGKTKLDPIESYSKNKLDNAIQENLIAETETKLCSINTNLYLLQFVVKHDEFKKYEGETPNLKLYSTELYQSMNPFWVVALTPVVVGFFGWMRRRKREPSTPTKIAIGLVITALSALVMVGAVFATNDMTLKAGSMWLFASYGVITVGELCLSPMGLSLVSKLSPPRITALMMGGYFLAISVGNKLSGMLSSLWEKFPQKENFFYLNFGLVMAAAVILILMLKWLNSVMRENNVQ